MGQKWHKNEPKMYQYSAKWKDNTVHMVYECPGPIGRNITAIKAITNDGEKN